MILRLLDINDKKQAMQAQQELALDDFTFLLNSFDVNESWAIYIERVNSASRDQDLPVGRVPATFLVAEVDGEIVGRVSIRYRLNEYLQRKGGHIGFGIRPEFRRRGFATEILLGALEIASALGVEKALVTCDDANIASSRVIEKCGGVLENIVEQDNGEKFRRYWLATEPCQSG
jgi:predicted acetyltransferase